MNRTTATQRVEIVPILDEGLGNQSYVVALGDGRALVIDPSRDPLPYFEIADRRSLQIAYAAETHLHADFISGSRELAARGATILAPAAAELQAAHRGLKNGDEVDLGAGLRLRALATPGHTPEHLSYLLLDGDNPLALFSGGALIPGGAARTDLIEPRQTEPLARALHQAVRRQLAGLPDALSVYPTHGGGSFCSAGIGGDRTTTLGRERLMNPLLKTENEDAFVRAFLGGLGTYPSYFRRLRAVNRQGARLYGPRLPELARMSVDAVRHGLDTAATLIDTRPYPEFASGQVPGALSIALRPAFASWLGWIVPADRTLIFVMGPEQDRRDLVSQCLKVGYEKFLGELDGGMVAWRAAGLPERTVTLRDVSDDLDPTVLDVRQQNEWDAGRLPGARHIELGSIRDANGLIPSGPLTIYCRHGDRAMTAASLLEATGHRTLAVLAGGFQAWSVAGRPVTLD
ncbi:MAG TPA: rhodanese-like domain-containing protein [Candidatus Dormibacteraeota bacterium]|nr:rhodanese-like domain-containing protein [Candidatus Dormibacteraeota bacterium]